MQLDGKRVLITGAGSGIGRALACQGAERGMVIALAGRRPEKLQETLKLLPGAGHFIIPADVTSADNRAILADRLASAWGHLDILVNNAGLVPGGPLGELTNEDLHAALATNLLAPIALARDMLTLMQASKGARIINVGSLLGDIPYPLFATYSASKAGLGGFSIALRRELAPLGIGVTHAAPRATQTEAAKPFETLAEPFEMKFDRPETVARAIWNAAERDADTVYPAGLERLFVFVQRIFPHLVDRSVAKQLS
ncbi:MAG TPA: SDR family NAD(P)-dependent oxidoreductase, partial [Rhizobiales bacterium]|nr:SDR family NAD(P)-dependent oxidoreductase [Hyphomicrobiales bacterium]